MADAPKNYYDILGIKPSASQEEIKARYKFLVKAFHPDRYTSEVDKKFAESNMREINVAYRVLSNAEERKDYDLQNGIKQKTEQANQSSPENKSNNTDKPLDLKEILDYLTSVDLKWQPRIKKIPDTETALVYYREIVGIFHSIAKDVYPFRENKIIELRERIDVGFFRMISIAISLGVEKKEYGLSTKYDEDELFFVICSICFFSFMDLLDSAENSGLISIAERISIEKDLYKLCLNAVLYCFHLISSKVELISRRRAESESYRRSTQTTTTGSKSTNPKSGSSNPQRKPSTPDIIVTTQGESEGCGSKVFVLVLVIVIILGLLGWCDANFFQKPKKTPTRVPTQRVYIPTPTNTKRIVYPTKTSTPRPTPTPDCLRWDQITTKDEGKTLCVYGTVRDTYFASGDIFFIRFGPNNSDFRLIVPGGYYYENIIGKCVKIKGKVKTYNSLPYIEVYDNLEKCGYSY